MNRLGFDWITVVNFMGVKKGNGIVCLSKGPK